MNKNNLFVNENDMLKHIILTPPPIIGYWQFGPDGYGTLRISYHKKKPNVVVRFCMKHLLGIYWKDKI